jgi:K+-transporting ATPase ATPase C chain
MLALRRQLVTAVGVTVCLLVLLCGVYPLAVTLVAQVAFPGTANGSLARSHGKVVGSRLIGQQFVTAGGDPDPRYFQPRPSAAGTGYDAGSSGAANLGPSSPLLIGLVPGVNLVGPNPYATPADPACVPVDKSGQPLVSGGASVVPGSCYPGTAPELAIAYRAFNGLGAGTAVPADAVTSSGSGLDPDISEANALDQAGRVATARGLSPPAVVALVRAHVDPRPWGFLGTDTVNVLDLNLALDALK